MTSNIWVKWKDRTHKGDSKWMGQVNDNDDINGSWLRINKCKDKTNSYNDDDNDGFLIENKKVDGNITGISGVGLSTLLCAHAPALPPTCTQANKRN